MAQLKALEKDFSLERYILTSRVFIYTRARLYETHTCAMMQRAVPIKLVPFSVLQKHNSATPFSIITFFRARVQEGNAKFFNNFAKMQSRVRKQRDYEWRIFISLFSQLSHHIFSLIMDLHIISLLCTHLLFMIFKKIFLNGSDICHNNYVYFFATFL